MPGAAHSTSVGTHALSISDACCLQEFGVNVLDRDSLARVIAAHATEIRCIWNLAAPLSVDTAKDPQLAYKVFTHTCSAAVPVTDCRACCCLWYPTAVPIAAPATALLLLVSTPLVILLICCCPPIGLSTRHRLDPLHCSTCTSTSVAPSNTQPAPATISHSCTEISLMSTCLKPRHLRRLAGVS